MRSSCRRSPQERISRPVVPSGSSLQAVAPANRPISGADRVLAKHSFKFSTVPFAPLRHLQTSRLRKAVSALTAKRDKTSLAVALLLAFLACLSRWRNPGRHSTLLSPTIFLVLHLVIH